MTFLEIADSTKETVVESFDRLAEKLLHDYQLQVNGHRYRLIDIEFYYYASGSFEDVYAHKHEAQLQMGQWYFHGSGIDITFGNGRNHGGILIRGIAKISGNGVPAKDCIQKEIHGPLNVKTEIFSSLHGAFEREANFFYFEDISRERMGAGMVKPPYIVKTRRIGLNSSKDDEEQSFYNGKYRYVIFPYLKLKNKTQIALDMQAQFTDMTKAEINKALGSVFLK